jgi:hypothetical protein
MEKDRFIIRNSDNIEIDGILYYIPERYTAEMDIALEHRYLFNYILAHVMHSRIRLDKLDMESITKTHMDKYLATTERLFAFVITGKLDIAGFSGWENDILAGVPGFIIPKLNPLIVERLEYT